MIYQMHSGEDEADHFSKDVHMQKLQNEWEGWCTALSYKRKAVMTDSKYRQTSIMNSLSTLLSHYLWACICEAYSQASSKGSSSRSTKYST